jgi:hypothetical protein
MKTLLIIIAIIATLSSCTRINQNESMMTKNSLKGISFDYTNYSEFVQK